MLNKKNLVGRDAEVTACAYLQRQGWVLRARNRRFDAGLGPSGQVRRTEVDIVVTRGREMLFVEVKYRRRADVGTASWEILTEAQLGRLRRARCYAAAIYPAFRIRIVLLWVDEKQTVHFLENY